MACLDTSFLVDLQRRNTEFGRRAARRVVELAARGETLATTRLNAAELYLGVELARDRRRELDNVERILSDLDILPFDDNAAWLFARSTAHLRRIGRPAGDMDVLIAATAFANGHCLVTRNVSHFAAIPDLLVETY
jgi:tRNA(fMet)-specific endonuclease VapC